jgi:hypothetical protein
LGIGRRLGCAAPPLDTHLGIGTKDAIDITVPGTVRAIGGSGDRYRIIIDSIERLIKPVNEDLPGVGGSIDASD